MYYFTPGPTQAHPLLSNFLNKAQEEHIFSLSHRSPTFCAMYSDVRDSLKKLFELPEDFSVFFMGSGTECMERIIQNTVEHCSFHIVNGAFSHRFYQCAVELYKLPRLLQISPQEIPDFHQIHPDPTVELIAITHSETSIGMTFSMEEMLTLKEKFPNALLAVDMVSSAPFTELDFSHIDMAFFSIQKGFGLPAGMGVLLVNEKALHRAKELQQKGLSLGSYHSFPNMKHYEIQNTTPETPNVLGIFLLQQACQYFLKDDITMRRAFYQRTQDLYTLLEDHPYLAAHTKSKAHRSPTMAVISTPFGSSKLLDHCKKHNFIIGAGYGPQKEELARVANFPIHCSKKMEELIQILKGFKSGIM